MASLIITILGCALASAAAATRSLDWTITVITLFALTLRGLPPIRSILVAGASLFLIVAFEAGQGPGSGETLAAVVGAVAAGAAGSAIATQRRYWQALEDRAQDAVASRELEAARRVAEERLRIARDLTMSSAIRSPSPACNSVPSR